MLLSNGFLILRYANTLQICYEITVSLWLDHSGRYFARVLICDDFALSDINYM